MKTLNQYCIEQFGQKLYKLSLDGGMTCPNRDGTLGTGGCIFCSQGGSGDFAEPSTLPVEEQLRRAKARVSAKFKGGRYIAYFQSYTNTYAPVDDLRGLFLPLLQRPDIAALSIGTRPDCLGGGVLALLEELNRIKPVWVELGLQTIHPQTAVYIRRGYPLAVYDEAASALRRLGIHTVTHVILGLPGEDEEKMLQTVRYAAESTPGIKLQLLHVLEGTDLAEDYRRGLFRTMEFEEYVALVARCVAILPRDTVVHRLTGDGPKKLLIAPLWSGDKKRVLNAIQNALKKEVLPG